VSRNDINTPASPSSSVAQPPLSSQPQACSHGGLLLLPDVVPPAPAVAPNHAAPPLNHAPPLLNRAPPPSMSSTGAATEARRGGGTALRVGRRAGRCGSWSSCGRGSLGGGVGLWRPAILLDLVVLTISHRHPRLPSPSCERRQPAPYPSRERWRCSSSSRAPCVRLGRLPRRSVRLGKRQKIFY
jgi:hypothetical protein